MDPFGDVYSVYVYTDVTLRRSRQKQKAERGNASYQFSTFGLFSLEIQKVGRGRHLLKRQIRQTHTFMRGEVMVTLHLRPIER